MPYATLDDLIDRAGPSEILEVADRDGDGLADPDVVASAFASAGQTIDAYLAARYGLPLSSTPAIVQKWAVSIARYHLHRDGAPDHVVRDYKEAMTELRDAAAGRLSLPDVTGATPAAAAGGSVRVDGPASVFDGSGLRGWP